jgi:hypothetical protein
VPILLQLRSTDARLSLKGLSSIIQQTGEEEELKKNSDR